MYYKLHYEKEIRKPKGKATFRFGSTMCKFNRGLCADIQLFISHQPRWFRTVTLTEIRA